MWDWRVGGGTLRERGNKENKYEQINMRAAEWVGRQRQSALVQKKIWEEVSIKHMCKIILLFPLAAQWKTK